MDKAALDSIAQAIAKGKMLDFQKSPQGVYQMPKPPSAMQQIINAIMRR